MNDSEKRSTQSSAIETARRAWRSELHAARRKLSLRRAVQGFAAALSVCTVGLIGALVWTDQQRFDPLAVQGAQELLAACLVVAIVMLAAAAFWKASPKQLVRRIEAPSSSMDGLLVSALELDASGRDAGVGQASPALAARLYARAAKTLAAGTEWERHERRTTVRFAWLSMVPVVATAAALILAPATWWHGLGVLLAPEAKASLNPYSLSVEPGDALVLEGEDFTVYASVGGFEPGEVSLYTRQPGAVDWTPTPMSVSTGSEKFAVNFRRPREGFEYRVAADTLRSQIYTLEVVPRPRIAEVSITYRYPESSGGGARTQTGSGDVSAVMGTRVEVRAKAIGDVAQAQLTLAGGGPVPMRREGEQWIGEFTLNADDSYRIDAMSSLSPEFAPASREYAVQALNDGRPTLAFIWPGRDLKVSAIEEVGLQIAGSDDIGIQRADLVISVNGAEETVVPLNLSRAESDNSATAPREFSTKHVIAMEELELTPGDLIAYHARVRDGPSIEREVATDIFFLEIRPFERHFRRAPVEGGGGGGDSGGGGGGGRDAVLAAQQRTVVIALFKLARDVERLEASVLSERAETISEGQERIRVRVEAIVRRLGQRSLVNMEPGYQQMAEELPKAATAMKDVEGNLTEIDARKALIHARQALAHLQRADAAFKEVRVAQAQRGAGGGGQRQSNDLTNLFQLELDRFRNQYSHVQRYQPGQQSRAAVDEAMRKLEELARRQEREMRRRAALRGQQGAGQGRGQEALAAAVDELLRELARLTRKKPNSEVEEARRQLADAARSMRRSGLEGASQRSQQRAQQRALDALRQAQRALRAAGPEQLADAIEAARRRAETAQREHEDVKRVTRGLKRSATATRDDEGQANEIQRARLAQEQVEFAESMRRLQESVRRSVEQAKSSEQSISQPLTRAKNALRDLDVEEELERARRNIAQGQGEAGLEPGQTRIRSAIDTVVRSLAEAEAAARSADGSSEASARRRLEQATRRLSDLRRHLDESRSRAGRDRSGDGRNSRSGDGRGQQQANANRQGQGQGRQPTRQAQAGRGQGQQQGQGPGQGPGQGDTQQLSNAQQSGQGGAAGQGQSAGQARAGGQRESQAGATGEPNGRAAGDGIARGGGRFGGWSGTRGNADFRGVREGLRSSAEALRDALDVLGPTAQTANDISALVADLERLLRSSDQAVAGELDNTLRLLQDIERSVREGESEVGRSTVARIQIGETRTEHRPLIEDYYERLGDVRQQ